MSPYRQVPERHPYETVLLAVFLVYGVSAITGLAPLPPSIREQVVHPLFRLTWAALLGLGAGLALAGLVAPRKAGVVKVTPVLLERVGITFVGIANSFYALVLVTTNGEAALYPAALTAAFGVASLLQARRLRRWLHSQALGGLPVPPTRVERFGLWVRDHLMGWRR